MKKESWGSRIGLILAMAGNAVGFGNFLRFPIQAVKNGGGAFIIPYVVCFFLMGIPLLLMEWAMGRIGGKKNNHCTPFMMHTIGSEGKIWKYIGAIGMLTNLVLLAYYTYIESWTLSYAIDSIMGTFGGKSQLEVAQFFENYVNIKFSSSIFLNKAFIFYVLCLLLNIYILSKGISAIEKVSKIAMPLLLFLALILAIKGWTLGTNGANPEHPESNAFEGLNFLWNPDFSTIWSPKVWLAAAGQIFFTLSLATGVIHCYASYIKPKQDIALGAVSAGFMNEFIEVILSSAIVIPIATGYLGLEWVKENAGFGMAFQTMPYLFERWGSILAPLGGLLWFGLLFFAGITSSMAFGISWVSFLGKEFGFSRKKSAWVFGTIAFVIGIPAVIFYKEGVFDEYDFWVGTMAVFLFGLFESIVFVWVMGIDKGWKEIKEGSDIFLPRIIKIACYLTPYLLSILFLGALFTPENNDWAGAFKNLVEKGWILDDSSLINIVLQSDLKQKLLDSSLNATQIQEIQDKLFYKNLSRIIILGVFIGICLMVHLAAKKRKKEGVLIK